MTLLTAVLLAALRAADVYTYWIEPCTRAETRCRKEDEALAEWAIRAWEGASGGAIVMQTTKDQAKARIRLYWVGARSGLYGEARSIVFEGKRGAEVYVRPDLSQLGPAIDAAGRADPLFRDTVVYLTCLHETGHALGLPHTAAYDDIMYSFQFGGDITEYFGRYRRKLSARDDIRRHPGISPDDRDSLIARHAAR